MPSVSRSHISVCHACLSILLMVIVLPEMMEAAWSRALPGREAAAQNELLRQLYCRPPSPSLPIVFKIITNPRRPRN